MTLVGPNLPLARLRALPEGEPLFVVVPHHRLHVLEGVSSEPRQGEDVLDVDETLLGRGQTLLREKKLLFSLIRIR